MLNARHAQKTTLYTVPKLQTMTLSCIQGRRNSIQKSTPG